MLLVEPTMFPPVPEVHIAGATAIRNRKNVGEPVYENVMFADACDGLPELRATDATDCPRQQAANKGTKAVRDNDLFMGFLNFVRSGGSRELRPSASAL